MSVEHDNIMADKIASRVTASLLKADAAINTSADELADERLRRQDEAATARRVTGELRDTVERLTKNIDDLVADKTDLDKALVRANNGWSKTQDELKTVRDLITRSGAEVARELTKAQGDLKRMRELRSIDRDLRSTDSATIEHLTGQRGLLRTELDTAREQWDARGREIEQLVAQLKVATLLADERWESGERLAERCHKAERDLAHLEPVARVVCRNATAALARLFSSMPVAADMATSVNVTIHRGEVASLRRLRGLVDELMGLVKS